jgi:hypothetical protein
MRGERYLAARLLLTVANDRSDLLAHFIEGDVQQTQGTGRTSFVVPKKAEQDVLRADTIMVKVAALALGVHYNLASLFSESFKH